ncbi:hypothetical protein AM593_09591, partial [Mytilus galloprovincialis]
MPDIRISPRGVACPWLSWIRWSHINSDPTDGQKSRIPLQTDEDESQIKKLNLEIKSLRKIKASVNNELRDMESKRQKLQVQISNYQKQIDILSAQIETSEKEIKSTQLTLEQLKLEKSEMDKQKGFKCWRVSSLCQEWYR